MIDNAGIKMIKDQSSKWQLWQCRVITHVFSPWGLNPGPIGRKFTVGIQNYREEFVAEDTENWNLTSSWAFVCMLQWCFCWIDWTVFDVLAGKQFRNLATLVWGRGGVSLDQPEWSIAVRWRRVLNESLIDKRFFWVIFHLVKAQEAQDMPICPEVRGLQKSNVNVVGWNNICHRARLHICKLVRHSWLIGFTVHTTWLLFSLIVIKPFLLLP
jgi:hypothetical protein